MIALGKERDQSFVTNNDPTEIKHSFEISTIFFLYIYLYFFFVWLLSSLRLAPIGLSFSSFHMKLVLALPLCYTTILHFDPASSCNIYLRWLFKDWASFRVHINRDTAVPLTHQRIYTNVWTSLCLFIRGKLTTKRRRRPRRGTIFSWTIGRALALSISFAWSSSVTFAQLKCCLAEPFAHQTRNIYISIAADVAIKGNLSVSLLARWRTCYVPHFLSWKGKNIEEGKCPMGLHICVAKENEWESPEVGALLRE